MGKRLKSAREQVLGLVLILVEEYSYGEPQAWFRQAVRGRLPRRLSRLVKG